MAPRRSALRLERLEVRRALAADDGSDPWDGVTPPDEGDVDVGGDVGGDVVVEWSDPGDVFVVMPAEWSGDGEKVPDGGLPMCWLPDYDAEGNPIPQPFWRTTGDDPSAGLLADGDPIAVDSSDDGLDAVSALSRPSTDEGPRSRPTDVVATSGPEGIVVSWNDPFANSGEGGPAIDGYLVEARRLRDADWSIVGSVTGATTVTVSGLDGGAHYAFRVTKTNLGMLQMLSAPSVPSRPLTTPGGVTIGVEQTAAGGARISWDPGNVGGGEQIVEFRRLAVTEWVRAGSFPAASGAATIDGLPGGRHYTFRILSAGGIYSPRSRAVTLPEQVDYLLRATSDAGGTVITWSDPLAATRTETIVEYRRLRDTVWSDLGSVASAAGEIGLAGLVPNAHYVFRLRQRDADGFLSRTVATRPVTVQPRLPDCWLPPPAPPTVDGSTLLIVNPYDGSTAPTLIHVPGSTTGGSAPGATGALVATGQLVASTSPLDTPVPSGDDHAASGDGAAG